MAKKTSPRTSIFIKNVPRNIKAHFKAYCAKREKTMSEAIIGFMADTVRKGETSL